MPTENIEWVSKTGLLTSFRTQLEQLLDRRADITGFENKLILGGRICQLKQIIEEVERT